MRKHFISNSKIDEHSTNDFIENWAETFPCVLNAHISIWVKEKATNTIQDKTNISCNFSENKKTPN
jgi:hypothetical protein